MLDMPGGVSESAVSRQRPTRERKQEVFPPASKPALSGLKHPVKSTPKFSVLGKLVGSPPNLQDFFLNTSKEGSAALILPESSVIVGRSVTSYKRDGWLELQERLPEELAVAGIWIFGVDTLRNFFEKRIKPKAFPNFNHLSTDIAWNKTWGKPKTVDLSPQEMFTKNSKEINALLRLKSVRWLFSVGLALVSVAYVIPTLNQLKTNAILQYLGRRKRETEGSNVQFGDPNAQSQATTQPRMGLRTPSIPGNRTTQPFTTSFNAPMTRTPQNFTTTTPNTQPTLPFRTPASYASYNQAYQPQFQGGNHPIQQAPQGKSPKKHKDVQFGSAGGSIAQGLGHLVEQTPYGSILVVDAGIAGGRGAVASKRSLFETTEVLVRDIGSLYFYILCTPHLMAGLGSLLDSAFKTNIGLQPKVAGKIHERIIQDAADAKVKLTPEFVEKAIKGATGRLADILMEPEGKLRMEMRSARTEEMEALLKKELGVYLQKPEIPPVILKHLKTKTGTMNTDQLQKLLMAIANQHEGFAKFSPEMRQNMTTAIKQAFRHTAGLTIDLSDDTNIQNHPEFKDLFGKLNPQNSQEAKELITRIRRTAHLDSMNQTHSMLRRSLNMMHGVLNGRHPELLKQGTELADWLDEALNRHVTIDEMMKIKPLPDTSDFQTKLDTLMNKLLSKTGKDSPESVLLSHYKGLITDMTRNQKGRLFSLAIDQQNELLGQKLRAMLKGGLENDAKFLSEALETVGQLETDSRKFINTSKATKMQESITRYTDALLEKTRSLAGKPGFANEMKRFLNLNRNLHYGARTMALSTTMFCLGWLVPHLQTLITKRLTGKDKHPGIASVANNTSEGSNAKPPAARPTFASSIATPYTAPYLNSGRAFPSQLWPAPTGYQQN